MRIFEQEAPVQTGTDAPSVKKDIKNPIQLIEEIKKVAKGRNFSYGVPPRTIGSFIVAYSKDDARAFDLLLVDGEVHIKKQKPKVLLEESETKATLMEEDTAKTKTLVKRVDVDAVYPALEKAAFQSIKEFEIYNALLARSYKEYVSGGTASIGWDSEGNEFVLRICKEFMVYATIFDLMDGFPTSKMQRLAKKYEGGEGHTISMSSAAFPLQFILLHEMGHILFRHCGKRGGLYQNFPDKDVNLYGDIIINLSITKMMEGHVDPDMLLSIGLGGTKSFEGSVENFGKCWSTFVDSVRDLLPFNSTSLSDFGQILPSPASIVFVLRPAGFVVEDVSTALLMHYYERVKAAFSLDPIVPEEEEGDSEGEGEPGKGEGEGKSGKGKGDPSEGDPGQKKPGKGSGQGPGSEDRKPGKRGPSNPIVDSIRKAKQKEAGREKEHEIGGTDPDSDLDDIESSDPAKEQEIDKAIEEGVRKADKKSDEGEDATDSLPVKTDGGPETLVSRLYGVTKSEKDWKLKLRKIIRKALGLDQRYNPVLPSRTIEGQFGRRQDVPKVDSVLIMLDCSASMGPPAFKAVFSELATMMKIPQFARMFRTTKTHLVKWAVGQTIEHKRVTGLHTLLSDFNGMGSIPSGNTQLGSSLVATLKGGKGCPRMGRLDLCLILTDGQIQASSDDDDGKKLFIQKHLRKRTLYILPKETSSSWLKAFDPTWTQRKIVFKKG